MAECIFSSLKAVCIMIADNIFSDGISFVAVNTQKMVKSFVLFGISRNLISWSILLISAAMRTALIMTFFADPG